MGRAPMLWLALSWLFLYSICANAIEHEDSSKSYAVDGELVKRADKYWLEDLGGKGKMPLAPGGNSYKFFRNVKDYGAKGDGKTDDTAAINRAASEGNRCGLGCAGTSTTGALVYFPPGTYLVKKPIVQYYYTQFVGDPNDRPVMKAHREFKGIAIFDTDPYIPGANAAQWYINQNQFFRQIRNFVLDMRDMKEFNYDETGQGHAPVGIHWQVAQATSLQNIKIDMRDDGKESAKTAIGMFTENGSGGFISDIEINGGFIGYQAGSQQFTMRNLKFSKSQTAIQVTWNWGMTWQQITVNSCIIGFNITGKTPDGSGNGQGVGSLAIIDSTFTDTKYAVGILPLKGAEPPELVLDNVFVSKTPTVVGIVGQGGEVYLDGPEASDSRTIQSWAMGTRYASRNGKPQITRGLVNPAPNKPSNLIDKDGKYFVRSKPDYGNVKKEDWIVVTDKGVKNDGTGDQTDAINKALSSGPVFFPFLKKRHVYFPAGIYQVSGTIHIPPGTVMVGSGWSSIRATGDYFKDKNNPKPVVQVGKPGDTGIVEISDMLFTVKGATAGAILMEWNINAIRQGSAAMWDSHFRIGGSAGSDLSLPNCPQSGGLKDACVAASMLLHITERSNGYFENVWAWTADHDIDAPLGGATASTSASLNIFTGRGVLVESKGPTWLYGTASEHNVLYQYELSKAENVYMGHLQTETPYFQPAPNALQPFPIGKFRGDPDFKDCTNDTCKESWGLRILDSKNVFIYSAGMYSFFNNYGQGCLDPENCQERLFRIERSKHVWVFNIFTKGTNEVVSGFGEIPSVAFNFTSKSGFTSEIGAYLPFAGNGSVTNAKVVYVDPKIWTDPKPNVHCQPPCIMVLPPSTLKSATTVTFPPLTTTLEVGWTTTVDGSTKFTTSVAMTTITIPPVTTSVVSFWNYNVTSTSSSASNGTFAIFPFLSIQPPPFTITQPYPTGVREQNSKRTIFPPPWPYTSSSRATPTSDPPGITFPPPPPPVTYYTTRVTDKVTPVTTFVRDPTATVVNGKLEPVVPCHVWFIFSCPPNVFGYILSGWKPGIHPPGPPPLIGPKPSITFPPIPWPDITIGPDTIPTIPPYSPEEVECETSVADRCATTVSIGTARRRRRATAFSGIESSPLPTVGPEFQNDIVRRQNKPTITTTVSFCFKVTGCHVSGTDLTSSITPEPTPSPPQPYVIYPKDPSNVRVLENTLTIESVTFFKSKSDSLGTMFFFVFGMTEDKFTSLRDRSGALGIEDILVPRGMLTRGSLPFVDPTTEADLVLDGPDDPLFANFTDELTMKSHLELKSLQSRAPDNNKNVHEEMAAISWEPDAPDARTDPTYYFDDSQGEGTFVYLVDWGVSLSHNEFSELNPRPAIIKTFPFALGDKEQQDNDSPSRPGKPGFHGSCMMAKMVGKTLGTARKATVSHTVINFEKSIFEHFLDGLMRVHDTIKRREHGEKAVVNLSLNFQTLAQYSGPNTDAPGVVSGAFVDRMALIIKALIKMGVVVVTGAGNRQISPIDGYPAKFKDPSDLNHIPDLIVVGSTTWYGQQALQMGQRADYIDLYAPGSLVQCVAPAKGKDGYRPGAQGTSISSAVVAGLASYLRGLNPQLTTARQVADLLKELAYSRPRYVDAMGVEDKNGIYPKMVWNGQTKGKVSPCIKTPNKQKRQDGDDANACVLPGNGNGGSGKTLTFSSGTASPTCTGNCGNYCTGFYCSAPCSTKCGPPPDNPTQTTKPDFFDPNNPNSCQNPNSSNYGNCNDPAPIAPSCKTTTISGTIGCYTSPTSTPTPTPTPAPPPPPSSPPPPPPDPITPLELKPVVCNKESDFPGHADISPDAQSNLADRFCEVDPSDQGIVDIGPGQSFGRTRQDTHDVNYYYEVSWVDGCKTTVDRQDIEDPIGGKKMCKDVFVDAFRNCNNGGVGGYIDAGCLRFSFVGGK